MTPDPTQDLSPDLSQDLTRERRARPDEVRITVCPNGPLLVHGPAQLQDADGVAVEHDRNVIALCRCGRSALKPLCDGSHRSGRFRDPATAAAISETLRTARPPRRTARLPGAGAGGRSE